MKSYTLDELENLADEIRTIRDQYLDMIPTQAFIILYRNLKLLQQEIRILTETDNFLKKFYGENSLQYKQSHEELLSTKININLKEIPIELFNNYEISPSIFEIIMNFIQEENSYESN